MPLVPCPKCATTLKLPDGVTAAVRCPKCQTVFSPPQAAPAFEVVEDEPAPPPPPPRTVPKTVKKPECEPEFEVVDDEPAPVKKKVVAREDDEPAPVKKKVVAREDDDDDRPRKKRRRDDDDDDDDDDRPRNRRKDRDRDRDDDDDDRPRKKSRRDDDDDDDYDDRPAGKRVRGAGAAKIALLLSSISLGLYLVSFALVAFFVFLAWVGVGYIPLGTMIVPGLLGLANWVVGGVGIGFAIAGPARARGLAIAAAAVSVVHIVLTFVVAANSDAGMFSNYTAQALGIQNKQERAGKLVEDTLKNPSDAKAKQKELEEAQKDTKQFLEDYKLEIQEVLFYYLLRELKENKDADKLTARELNVKIPEALRWQDLISLLPFADQLIANLAFHNKTFGEYVLPLIGGLAEIARLILLVLLIGSLSKAVKGHDAVDKAKYGLIAVCIGVGVALLVSLLVSVMIDSARSDMKKIVTNSITGGDFARDPEAARKTLDDVGKKLKSAQASMKHWSAIGALLNPLLYAGMLVLPVLAGLQGIGAASRAAR